MNITSSEFIKSCTEISDCPEGNHPEYGLIGRSNVGKSSFINMLTSKRKLAKVSSSPGKTRTINHFLINHSWYLVDLPGFGFAKVSKKEREKWTGMIRTYITKRENLALMFILVDINVPPQNSDIEFMRWMGLNGIPFAVLFTKTDKLSKNKVQQQLKYYKKALSKDWEEFPRFFLTSSKSETGKEEILEYIEKINLELKKR